MHTCYTFTSHFFLAQHRHWLAYKGPPIQCFIQMTSNLDFADDGFRKTFVQECSDHCEYIYSFDNIIDIMFHPNILSMHRSIWCCVLYYIYMITFKSIPSNITLRMSTYTNIYMPITSFNTHMHCIIPFGT